MLNVDVGYLAHFSRMKRLREELLKRALSIHSYEHLDNDLFVSLAGDQISDEIRIWGRYERRFLDFVGERIFSALSPANKRCLDIGANIGTHSLFFAKYFSEVIAFEPNPLAAAVLETNLKINGVSNVLVHNFGLSDSKRDAILSVGNTNIGAARIDAQSISGQTLDASSTKIMVHLEVGDDVIMDGPPIAFVKLDVEGHEPAVLRGMLRTISTQKPVLMVEQLAPQIDLLTGTSEVSTILSTFGYSPYVFDRVALSKWRLLNNTIAILTGRMKFALTPAHKFEQRNYSSVLYIPNSPSQLCGNKS